MKELIDSGLENSMGICDKLIQEVIAYRDNTLGRGDGKCGSLTLIGEYAMRLDEDLMLLLEESLTLKGH